MQNITPEGVTLNNPVDFRRKKLQSGIGLKKMSELSAFWYRKQGLTR
jgi:hypothetical protein